ncbi:hypothetical protein B5S28_g4069 [[Candida] boidinii]|nr:hypothetical protein B5S28_g4069 [[Candida] boidinii]
MSDTPDHRKGGNGSGSGSSTSNSILSKSKHKNKVTTMDKLDLKSINSPSLSEQSIGSPTEFSNYNHIPPIPTTSSPIELSNIIQEEQAQLICNPLNDLSSGSSPEPQPVHSLIRHALNIDTNISDSEMISRGSSLYEDHIREHHNSHIMQLTKDISIPTHSTKSSLMQSTTDSSDYYSSDNSIPKNRHISKKIIDNKDNKDNKHNTHNTHNTHNKEKHIPHSSSHNHHNPQNKNIPTKSKHINQNDIMKINNKFVNVTNSKVSLLSQEEESLLLQALNQSDIRLLKSSIKGNSDIESNIISSSLLDMSFESDNIISHNSENLTSNKDQDEKSIQDQNQEHLQPEYRYQHQTLKLEPQTPIKDPKDNVFVSPKRKRKIPPNEKPIDAFIIEPTKEKPQQEQQEQQQQQQHEQQPSGEPEFNFESNIKHDNIKITPATPKSQKSPNRLSSAAQRISLSPLKSSKNFFKSLSPMRQKNSNKINKKKISLPVNVSHQTSNNKQLSPTTDTSFKALGSKKIGIIPNQMMETKDTKQTVNQMLLPGLKSVSSFKTASIDEPIFKKQVDKVPSSSRKVSKNYQEILQRNISVKSRASSAITEGTGQTFMSTTTEGGDEFDISENMSKSLNDDNIKANEREAYRTRRLEHLKRKKIERQIRNSHRFSHGVFTESVLANLENDPNIAVNSNRSSRHSRSSDSSILENLIFNEDSLNSSSLSNSNNSTSSGSKSNGGSGSGINNSNNSNKNNNESTGNRTQFLIYKDKKSSSSLPAIPLHKKSGKENLLQNRAISSTGKVNVNVIPIRGREESISSNSSNTSFNLKMKKRTGTSPCKYRSIIDIYSSSNEDEISMVSSGKSDINRIENIKDTLINTNYYDSSSSGSPDLDSTSIKFDQSTITDRQQLHNQRLSNINKRYSIKSDDTGVVVVNSGTRFSGDHSNLSNLLLTDNINNFQINTQSQVSVTGASEFFSAQEELSELSMNQENSKNELELKKFKLIKKRNSISSISNTSSTSSSSSSSLSLASSAARSKRRPVSTGSITSNTPIRRPTHNHNLQMDNHQLISNDEITQAMKDPISLFSEQNIIRETINDDDEEVKANEKLFKDTRKSKRFSKNLTNIVIQDDHDDGSDNNNQNRRLTINAGDESNEISNKLKKHVYNLQVDSSTDAFDSSNHATNTEEDIIVNPIYQNEDILDNVDIEEKIEQEPVTVTKVRSKSPSKLLSLFPYSKDSRISRYGFRDSFFGGGSGVSNKEGNITSDVTPDSGVVNKNDESVSRRSSIFNSISKRNSRNLLQFNAISDNSEILMSSLANKGDITDKQQMNIPHSKSYNNSNNNNESERSFHLVHKKSSSLSPAVIQNSPSSTENDNDFNYNNDGGGGSEQSNLVTTPNFEQTELDSSIIEAQTEGNIQTLEKVYFKRYSNSNNSSGLSQHSVNSQTKLMTSNNENHEFLYSSSKEGRITFGQSHKISPPQEKNVIDITGATRSSSSSPSIAPVHVATRVSSSTESMDSIQLKDQFILSYQFDKYYKDHMGYKPELLNFHRQYKAVNNNNNTTTMNVGEDGRLMTENGYCSKNDAILMIILSIIAPPFWIIMALGLLDNKIGKIPSTYKLISGIFAITISIGAIIGIAVGLGYGIHSLRG